jgi:hypothetical protein
MRPRTDLPIPPKPRGQFPHILGQGMRDRLLMTLAVNDRPLYVTELAELLGSWHSKIDQALVPLEQTGIIASTFARNNLRWVGLNTAFPAYPQAVALLRRLEERWPQTRVDKPRRRAERVALSPLRPNPGRRASLPSSARLLASDVDMLFYSKAGTGCRPVAVRAFRPPLARSVPEADARYSARSRMPPCWHRRLERSPRTSVPGGTACLCSMRLPPSAA